MKILLTVHQFFPQFAAGTEVLTYSVARELIERGHSVHVLTGYPSRAELRDEDRFDEYDFEGIHVYRFHHAFTPMAGQTSMVALDFDNRLVVSYFDRILKRLKPDAVHFFHLNRLGTGLIECAVQASIPCFMTPTDFWAICPTGQLVFGNGGFCMGPSANAGNCVKHFAETTTGGITRIFAELLPIAGADLLVRLTQKGVLPPYPKWEEVMAVASRLRINVARLNQLNRLIVPNAFVGEILVRNGVSPDLVIHSGYGIDLVSTARSERRSVSRHPLRVGFIGTHAPHKGCHVLIEAFNTLPRGQAVLRIYGNREGHTEYSGRLKLLAGDNDAIEFCGTFHNSRIGDVLADIDVLVVPSLWYENTPLVVYSAQAAHCPVLASDLPGISSVILDEENGLLFDVADTDALARQLSRFIDEPGLAARLSGNSRQPKSTATYVDELLNVWVAA